MRRFVSSVAVLVFLLGAVAMVGCDECTLYCEEVADCIEDDVDDWSETGWADRAEFVNNCTGDYPPGPGMNRVCQIARTAFVCNEGDWSY